MSVIHVTKHNFEQEVLQSDKRVLVDFWAAWCGPCRMIAPTVEQIAQERPDIKVVKINVDDDQELAIRYQIMSIPTLLVVENGEVIEQSVGVKTKEQILKML